MGRDTTVLKVALLAACLSAGIGRIPCNRGFALERMETVDPFAMIEGGSPEGSALQLVTTTVSANAALLAHLPPDYNWWNGCTPTASAMLFAYWREAGYNVFPGDPRNIPSSYSATSSIQSDYQDARGVNAGWAHKQSGISLGSAYGNWKGHAPDSLADFLHTENGNTSRSYMAQGVKNFGAWDDPRTTAIESQRFTATTSPYISERYFGKCQ